MMANKMSIAVILLLLSPMGAHSLFCHKCLAMDCMKGDIECQQIKEFVQKELKPLYHIDGDVATCPQLDLDGMNDFRQMQIDDVPCPWEIGARATCALGRMQIRILENVVIGGNETKQQRYHHGTILGCAKRQLISRVYTALRHGSPCDYLTRNISLEDGKLVQIEMEHCNSVDRGCQHADYCIKWEDSEVLPWTEIRQSHLPYPFTLVVGSLVLGVGFAAALLSCALRLQDYRNDQIERRPPPVPPRSSSSSSSGNNRTGVPRIQCIPMSEMMSVDNSGTMKRPSVPPPQPPSTNPPESVEPAELGAPSADVPTAAPEEKKDEE